MEKGFEKREFQDILKDMSKIRPLHEKMEKRKSIRRPDSKNFIGHPGYSKEDIVAEIEKVSELKKRWAKEQSPEAQRQKQVSDILEGVVIDQLSAWFAENVQGFYTSEEDDVLRGVDAVAEMTDEEDKHYLGFAIDVTMAKDANVLDAKLARNWKDIEENRFPEVKYFEDDDENKMRLQPPRVLIAVNPDMARDLISLEFSNRKDALRKHGFRNHLVWQIKEQLESYYRYYENKGNDKMRLRIAEALDIFYKVVVNPIEPELAHAQEEVFAEEDFDRIRKYCSNKVYSVRNWK